MNSLRLAEFYFLLKDRIEISLTLFDDILEELVMDYNVNSTARTLLRDEIYG